MNSLERKGSGKATFLNCLWRSVAFRTMALLDGADSLMLFVKAYAVYYLVMIAVGALSSSVLGTFQLGMFAFDVLIYLAVEVFSLMWVLFVCFILNLLLVDRFTRVLNIFTFSGVHKWFYDILVSVYIMQKKYDARITRDKGLLRFSIRNYILRSTTHPEQNADQGDFVEYLMFVSAASITWMFVFVAFIVLFLRNIRTLCKP